MNVIGFLRNRAMQYTGDRAFDAVVLLEAINALEVEERNGAYLGDLYRTDYIVEGRGAFPVDMLRYTNSWPRDEGDVHGIESSLMRDDSTLWRLRLTKLHRDPDPHLSADRWESKFRWRVVGEIETVRR